jgi:hypothetical protein
MKRKDKTNPFFVKADVMALFNAKIKRTPKKVEAKSYRLNRSGCQAANPYLVQSLDISTGHLTKKEADLLDDASKGESENPVTAYKYEYGHIVHIPTEDPDYLAMAEYGYSKQFIAILRRAKELGCKYVQFDCDGIQYDDLETFEW